MKQLLQQALDALIESRDDVDLCYAGVKAARLSFRQERQLGFYEEQLIKHDAAIEALKQALAQQEPPGPATPEDMKIYKGIADGYRRDAAQQEPNPWQTAVIDQLVIHHVYQAAHDTDPRKAVHDLLCISNDIACTTSTLLSTPIKLDMNIRSLFKLACRWKTVRFDDLGKFIIVDTI